MGSATLVAAAHMAVRLCKAVHMKDEPIAVVVRKVGELGHALASWSACVSIFRGKESL